MTENDAQRFLIPVDDSVTFRNTVAYAAEVAAEAADEGPVELHFVNVASGRAVDPGGASALESAEELLERATVWIDEDLGDDEDRDAITVETAIVGADRYLFAPDEYATALVDYADEHGIDEFVLDPEYDPGATAPMLRPLERELARRDVVVEQAPVERPTRRTVVARAVSLPKYLVVFGASFLFYLLLGALGLFDVVTGAVTAGIVAALLAPVAFGRQPSLPRLARQSVRLVVYVPYLLWEIAKANVHIAYVVLHPSLPIDPKTVEFRAAVWGDTPVTTLANSITLTPGTLTVDVSERAFTIHTLTGSARADLFDGALERAVRFVFYGRGAARIPTPAERGDSSESDEATAEPEDTEVTADD